jgi:hypothetical protein
MTAERFLAAAVREKSAKANKQLELAETASESAWDDVKVGFRKSNRELMDAFAESRQWLSDKLAP